MSVRVFLRENGDLAIQWADEEIFVITEGTLDLVEDTHGVLDYGQWTELTPEVCHSHQNPVPCSDCRADGTT